MSNESAPTLAYSMDVNALNYCRFSFLQLPPSCTIAGIGSSTTPATGLLALPNLVDSSTVNISPILWQPPWLISKG